MKKNNIREGCCCGEGLPKQIEHKPTNAVRIKVKRGIEHLDEALGEEELRSIIMNQLKNLDESELEDLIRQYGLNRT